MDVLGEKFVFGVITVISSTTEHVVGRGEKGGGGGGGGGDSKEKLDIGGPLERKV